MRFASIPAKVLAVIRYGAWPGWCPICGARTLFVRKGGWDRDDCLCVRCRSIPRWRAMAVVLDEKLPTWKSLEIHESSPEGAFSRKLQAGAPGYSSSQFFPGVEPGTAVDGVRCEDLRKLTFPDSSLDLLVTQDVMEHVPDPDSAWREIARVLRPGGIHLFTVPLYPQPTRERARQRPDGSVELLMEAQFHGNPVDPNGSLVVTEWGPDLLDRIRSVSGMETERISFQDRSRGLLGEFLDVLVSRKRG